MSIIGKDNYKEIEHYLYNYYKIKAELKEVCKSAKKL